MYFICIEASSILKFDKEAKLEQKYLLISHNAQANKTNLHIKSSM